VLDLADLKCSPVPANNVQSRENAYSALTTS